MMVASFLLGLGVVGVAALLVASSRTAAVAESHNDASALAAGELEVIRSFDYELVGIEPRSDGYISSFEDRKTVTETGGNLVEARSKVEIDDTVFEIHRSVTWAVVGKDEQAYKIAVVIVEWETHAGRRSLRVQTGLHEGLEDV